MPLPIGVSIQNVCGFIIFPMTAVSFLIFITLRNIFDKCE
jgi:hypothetical protein